MTTLTKTLLQCINNHTIFMKMTTFSYHMSEWSLTKEPFYPDAIHKWNLIDTKAKQSFLNVHSMLFTEHIA